MAELPLIKAAAKGDLEAIRRLLAAGRDVDERGEPLSDQEMKAAKTMLGFGDDTDGAAQAMGRTIDITPLMAAAEQGSEEVVAALLDAGADVDAADSLKRTAIMIAIEWKHEAIARRLLEAGADPNVKDLSGQPVLSQAISAGLLPLAHALLDAGAKAEPKAKSECLPLTALAGREGEEARHLMLRLLDEGAKPTHPAMLVSAIEKNDIDLVRRLIDAGAPLFSSDWFYDPLSRAFEQQNPDLIRLLLDAGAEIHEQPGKRSILTYIPTVNKNEDRLIECAELLVAAGAKLEHADRHGFTPLHGAVHRSSPRFAQWLLDKGVNPNPYKEGRQTPLDYTYETLDDHENYLKRAIGLSDEERKEAQESAGWINEMIKVLEAGGGQRCSTASDVPAPPSPELEKILATPVAERRGLCDAAFFKCEQMMIRANIDRIANLLEKDRQFERVERDVFARLDELEKPVGDVLALVKLVGHDWVYVAGGRRPRGDSPMQGWSKKLKSRVLYAGEQSTASVVYYWLYENGDCAEVFESDGQWFRGGVEIDPEVQDESERMQGTSFSSLRREPEDVDWSAYESEWQFVEEFFRSEDAYLTFFWAGFDDSGDFSLTSYHKDEIAAENIERVDVAFFQPTAMQKLAAETLEPTPEEDALLEAIHTGDEDGVAAAIASGADVHKRLIGGQGTYLETAVKYAVWCKSEAIVERLLRAGADPNISESEPIVTSLTLHTGTAIIDIRIIKLLLEAGADVDARQTDKAPNLFAPGGRTALAVASSFGTFNGVRLLLKSGANTTIRDDAGKTPLERAKAHLRMVKKWSLKPAPPDDIHQRVAEAQAVVDLLEAIEEGRFDVASLPEPDEIIADEERRLAEREALSG